MKRLYYFLISCFFTANVAIAEASIGTYSAFWVGLPVGTVTITNDQTAGEYNFSMTLQSGGITGPNSFTTTFSSAGNLTGNPVQPYVGRFQDVRRGQTRSETVRFGDGLPSFTSTPAYRIPPEFQFDLNRTAGSLDPASTLFSLLYAASMNQCSQRFTVYDGFSLYSAAITDEGMHNVRNKYYRGPARRCRLRVSAIAGKSYVDGSSDIPDMVVSVAEISPGKPAMPIKGALFVGRNRAGLRLDHLTIR